jgi:hypothetical protein
MATKCIRQIRIDGQVAYVPLTRGYEAVIDVDDVHLVDGRNWHSVVRGFTTYASCLGDLAGGRQARTYMHRLIIGFPSGFVVDHCDGDGLNNRRGNLRKATTAQNQANCRMHITNTSGFKGVSFHLPTGRWQAQISYKSKNVWLGYFDTPENAHAAYLAEAIRLRGEFVRAS